MAYQWPAPPYLGSMFFNQNNLFYWKEVYWVNGGSIAAAQSNLNILALYRAACMTDETHIVGCTISDQSKFRDVYQVGPLTGYPGTFGAPGDQNAPAPNCALIRLGNAFGKQVSRPIRSFPLSQLVAYNSFNPAGGFITVALANFISQLVSYASFVVQDHVTHLLSVESISTGHADLLVHNRKTGTRPFAPYRGRHA